jgi:hypothetical protein
MTSQFFFWNVFPWLVGFVCLGIIAYERYVRPKQDK